MAQKTHYHGIKGENSEDAEIWESHRRTSAELADDAFKEAMMEAGHRPSISTTPGTDNPRPMAPAIVPCGGSSMGF